MPIRQLKEWWNSPPVKDEPSTQDNNVKAISAHYRAESKRLDDELIKAKKGKEADLNVYGYIRQTHSCDP